MPAIQYKGVCKAFDAPVLSGVDLDIEEGETVSIVGPSGTGKSVLLKTTIGLIMPDAGDILVDGESIASADRQGLENIRRKVGYVFQYAALFDSMTIFENVAQGLREEELESLGAAELEQRVNQALVDVHLEPDRVLAKLPSELSGGMRKRVGVARAIVGRPRIILYDEPVTGLDPVTSAAVSQLIVRIAEATRVTSVVVTHDVEGALLISNRIALLDHGKLRFVGTPEAFRESRDPLVLAFYDRKAAAAAALAIMEQP
jgi:phospholipid/cholesterol/gamma-HCH transport system ATP-binding protein